MRGRFLALWVVAVVATAAAFVVHLALRFEIVRYGYALGEARRERERLIEERRLLSLEAEMLRHPERVEAIAKGVLGMEEPPPNRVILLPRRGPGGRGEGAGGEPPRRGTPSGRVR
jgi:cell division protein FtsL